MAEPMDDRFSHITADPRFRTLRKADKRVKVDKRFSKMFTEKKFKLKYSVDKRGKRINKKEEDFKKFYDLSDSESDAQKHDSNDDLVEEIDSKIVKPIDKPKIPNARGENTDEEIEFSSSSESEDSEGETEELIHEWNEWDKDVPKTEISSKRLAMCNLDWDRISARDLFVLVNSFKPSDGSILSVKIYPSQLGLERMKVEAESGPIPFLKGATSEVNEDQSQNDELGDPTLREELRQYELTKLKYYYAVVECDSALTAEVLYNELDGMEYESSSTALDLRFIDDETRFEGQPKSECHSMPDMSSYKAPQFVNTALQQSKVQMTWDQTDPKRKDVFERAFHKEDDDDDLKAYLATSSEDDSDCELGVDQNEHLSTEDKISKYKNLLNSLDESKEEKNDDMEMEITWEPDLKDVTEDLVSRKRSEKEMTTFEHDHVKMKEKRRLLKRQGNDQELVEVQEENTTKNKRRIEEKEEKDANLELLVMEANEEPNKRHFNYKNIIENKTKSKFSDSFRVSVSESTRMSLNGLMSNRLSLVRCGRPPIRSGLYVSSLQR